MREKQQVSTARLVEGQLYPLVRQHMPRQHNSTGRLQHLVPTLPSPSGQDIGLCLDSTSHDTRDPLVGTDHVRARDTFERRAKGELFAAVSTIISSRKKQGNRR